MRKAGQDPSTAWMSFWISRIFPMDGNVRLSAGIRYMSSLIEEGKESVKESVRQGGMASGVSNLMVMSCPPNGRTTAST